MELESLLKQYLNVIERVMQVDPQLWALSLGSVLLNAVLIVLGTSFFDQMQADKEQIGDLELKMLKLEHEATKVSELASDLDNHREALAIMTDVQ